MFWLQLAIKTIVANQTNELEDRRRSFENAIQLERIEDKAYCARFPYPP